ncbi:MAG: helix-turn-helix transcriptional regulator [Bacilli bacterium]|nr:helix-turn-helix transcriptional regulator [Bacilli bacterium]
MAVRYEELRSNMEKRQGDIAEILNVKRNTYSKWENEINDMPVEKANILANYYKVTFDYMLGLTRNNIFVDKDLFIDWDLFTERLVKLRKDAKLSQEQVSEKLGFAQQTYSHFEVGDRRPTTLKVLIISQYFNVSSDYLIGRVDNDTIK